MSFLYPGEYIDSTYRIDFDKLYKEGYRGVIFDIDNTLVTHGSPADERAIALFKHQMCIRDRVFSFAYFLITSWAQQVLDSISL